MDLLDLFERGSAWTRSKVAGATDRLGDPTPCDGWEVRTLLDHVVDTLRYFAATGRGEDAELPGPTPPPAIGDDPLGTYDARREETLRAYREPGVIEKTGPSLGIAFADQLIHGWDLAKATGQDAAMPDGLADAAYEMIHGRFTDDQRQGVFGPEVAVGEGASPQERLLAYTGRTPA